MAELYYAKPGPITPIGLPGHNLAIWATPNWVCYRIFFFEGLSRSNDFVFDLGAVAAGGQSALTALVNLEMSNEPPEMVQARFYAVDDCRFQVQKGQSDVRFKTKNRVARIDKFSRLLDPCMHLTEFVILKDDEPQAQATNPGGLAVAQSRLAIEGYKYILDDLKKAFSTVAQVEAAFPKGVTFIAAGGL